MKVRTLIVDDEPLARERIRRLLEGQPDVKVIGECQDGSEALEAIRQQRPDLVFLDIQMPELDGFGLLQALGSEALPAIIFVTAHDRFALRAFEVHALDYLLKPFDSERFEAAHNPRPAMAGPRADLRLRPAAQLLFCIELVLQQNSLLCKHIL